MLIVVDSFEEESAEIPYAELVKDDYAEVCKKFQNAGQIQSMRIDNSTFERVEEFKYLGTTLTNQNSIAEEVKSRLRSRNACYHSV